jgi:hypothetical protein
MVAWLLTKDTLTCLTNARKVYSQLRSCFIIFLMIQLGMQVSICSNGNCGPCSTDILLWRVINRNESYIIDSYNQSDIHCPH